MKPSIFIRISIFFALFVNVVVNSFAEDASMKDKCPSFFSKIFEKKDSTENYEATLLKQIDEAVDSIKKSLFGSEEKMQEIESNLNRDLLFIYRGTNEDSVAINKKVLEELEHFPMKESNGKRIVGLTLEQMKNILFLVKINRVAAPNKRIKYETEQTRMGFCFGRAMTAHLTALAEGVDKKSIRKIWAVGDINKDGERWNYHVATIVRDDKGAWYAIDPAIGTGGPTPINDWYALMKIYDTSGNMRIYSTEPSRFLPTESQKYSNKKLSDPAFLNYFNDLIETFKENTKGIMTRRKFYRTVDQVKEEENK